MQDILSFIPLLCVLAAWVYASLVGVRLYRKTGKASVLGVAVAMLGMILGRLLDRFVPLVSGLDDWVNYRGAYTEQVTTKGERFLAVMSVEVDLLFLFAALISVLAVTLIRRDVTPQTPPAPRSIQAGVLLALFAASVGIAGRAKIAAYLAFLLAKANLL